MSKEIIPRWEWRTFGENFGGSENPFAAFEASGTADSDEIYFLSPANSENVKVRDGLMDIKKFQTANSDGLEQWKPVMKHGFPLPAAEVKRMFEVLGVARANAGPRGLQPRNSSSTKSSLRCPACA